MMAELKHMHMVTAVVHDASDMTVLYGPGEYHEPGTLPDGVPYSETLVSEAQLAASPAHAQPRAEPPPAPEPQAPPAKPAAAAAKTPGKA
jgi:hypothetical protein